MSIWFLIPWVWFVLTMGEAFIELLFFPKNRFASRVRALVWGPWFLAIFPIFALMDGHGPTYGWKVAVELIRSHWNTPPKQ